MNMTRFDVLTRLLATGANRRGLLRSVAALGLGGGLMRAATARARPLVPGCGPIGCAPGYCLGCALSDDLKRCNGCICYHCFGGIGGGGTARSDAGGEVDLSLLATRKPDSVNPGSFLVSGQITWADPDWEDAGLQFESLQVTAYGPTDGVEGGRDVAGWLQSAAVDAPVPFFLQAVDAGPAGSGQDTVRLQAGDAVPAERLPSDYAPSGFSYTFEGALSAGDLTLLRLPDDRGESLPATPIA